MRVHDLKKKSDNRFRTNYQQALGIQTYGEDNLYPQTFRNIVAASSTASECADRFADFIEGNGFREVSFSEYVVNRKEKPQMIYIHWFVETWQTLTELRFM